MKTLKILHQKKFWLKVCAGETLLFRFRPAIFPPAEIVANAEIISMQTILITMEREAAAVSLNQWKQIMHS